MAHFKIESKPVMAAPNVIPMADIMLVLLIIFMVVTPMLQRGFSVDLARVANPMDLPDADHDDSIIVAITRDGVLYVGNQRTADDQLTAVIRDKFANRIDKTIFISSDGRAKYGTVSSVVDMVRSAGVDKVGLLTQRVERRPATAPAAPSMN
jgi:biopolymer transport protein ExbD/biopolymer transport protein TolR